MYPKPRIIYCRQNWVNFRVLAVGILGVAGKVFGFNLRLKNTQGHNGLAGTASSTARICGVVGSLCREGG